MHSDDFEDHLAETLVTRPLIEQAKGVLAMARCVPPEHAFGELRRACENHEVPVGDLASALVAAASGRTPEDPQLRKVIWHEWGSDFPNC
jgi:AmiR/NasT family two-component response regulator